MNFIKNLIWLVFGGLFAALGYIIGGLVLCITIIGIPFGLQCFKLAGLVLWPFDKNITSHSVNTGCFGLLFNIIWLLSGGFYTAIYHLIMGLILCITIIGLPWGRKHFQLAEVSMMPFGKKVE